MIPLHRAPLSILFLKLRTCFISRAWKFYIFFFILPLTQLNTYGSCCFLYLHFFSFSFSHIFLLLCVSQLKISMLLMLLLEIGSNRVHDACMYGVCRHENRQIRSRHLHSSERHLTKSNRKVRLRKEKLKWHYLVVFAERKWDYFKIQHTITLSIWKKLNVCCSCFFNFV